MKLSSLSCCVWRACAVSSASGGGQRAEEETGAADDGETSGTGGHDGGRPEGTSLYLCPPLCFIGQEPAAGHGEH